MRLIYAQGFSRSEREDWRAIVFNNLLTAFRAILDAMEDFDVDFADPANSVRPFLSAPTAPLTSQEHVALIIVDRDLGPKDQLPDEYLHAFKALWADAGVQQAISKGVEYALHDNLD